MMFTSIINFNGSAMAFGHTRPVYACGIRPACRVIRIANTRGISYFESTNKNDD